MAARTMALKKLGAAAGASFAASAGISECRSAPQDSEHGSILIVEQRTESDVRALLAPDKIDQASSLILDSSADLLTPTWSIDGSTPWLGLADSDAMVRSGSDSSEYEYFVKLAGDVAKDPTVQRIIMQREKELQRRCVSASDSAFSLCESDLNDWSTEESHTAMHTAPASLAGSVCGSDLLIVENKTLREENVWLKAELRRVVSDSEVAMLHAKQVVHACVERAIENVKAKAVAAAAASKGPTPAGKAPRAHGGRSSGSMPYNAAVVAAAMAVGLLAILVSRNPASAKMAASATAALCFSLLQRVPKRHPTKQAPAVTKQVPGCNKHGHAWAKQGQGFNKPWSK
jgi:hypothetical protein